MTSGSNVRVNLERWGLFSEAEKIAKEHHVPIDRMLGRTRTKATARARHALMAYLRSRGYSLPEIGSMLDRDHSTISSGIARHKQQVALPVAK